MAGYIGNKAVNLSTSGADISGTANLDIVDIDGAVDMASTLAVGGAATFATLTGATINATTVIDAPDIETAKISARDGTTAINIADSDGDMTFPTQVVMTNNNHNEGALYLRSTAPIIGFTDTNSFTDANDIIFLRAGSNNYQLQYYDDSASATSTLQASSLTETVFNENSLDIDFRVESDNDTHAFFVEGSTGNISMSTSDPDSNTPQTHFPDKRSFVSHNVGGSQVVMSRSDTSVAPGNYIGGYLFKTNDSGGGNKFGGMIATADDTTGNGNLEFFPVSTHYETSTTSEGHMQLDDTGDLFLGVGSVRIGRSHGNVYTTAEETVTLYHVGSGSGNSQTRIVARDGTGGDDVFRHTRQGTVKSEIEENGDFLSATDSYGQVSDGRLKENIVDSGSQWDDIKALQIKKYSFIDAELDAPNMIGVIAQDLLAAGMTGLVKQKFKTDAEDNPILDADGNHDYIYTVKGSVMQMKALKALQEAMAKIETLEARVAALEEV